MTALLHIALSKNRGPHVLTWYPTQWRSAGPISCATRCATDTALIRRGCVTRTLHFAPSPLLTCPSNKKRGIRVVLPQPVSPAITTTCEDCTAASTLSLYESTGSSVPRPGPALIHRLRRWSLRLSASSGRRARNGLLVIASVMRSSWSSELMEEDSC